MKNLIKMIKLFGILFKDFILFIWALPQNIIGIIYRIVGGYKKSKVSKYGKAYQKVKNMKDGVKTYNDNFYYWKNVYDFKNKKHRKTNTWVIGNFVFIKISVKEKVRNYELPYSDLQFASGYRKLSNMLGPLYTFVILIPTILRNFRYDHFYSKKHKNEPELLKLYWYKWWITKLINKVLIEK